MNSITRLSPEKLMRAIRAKGLTFVAAAEQARRHLPEDSRLSHTSVWSYATGRATPKRLTYIEAIEKAVGVKPHGLSEDGNERDPVPSAEDRAHDVGAGDVRAVMIVVDDIRGDRAHIRLRLSVTWPVALKILEALKSDEICSAA